MVESSEETVYVCERETCNEENFNKLEAEYFRLKEENKRLQDEVVKLIRKYHYDIGTMEIKGWGLSDEKGV